MKQKYELSWSWETRSPLSSRLIKVAFRIMSHSLLLLPRFHFSRQNLSPDYQAVMTECSRGAHSRPVNWCKMIISNSFSNHSKENLQMCQFQTFNHIDKMHCKFKQPTRKLFSCWWWWQILHRLFIYKATRYYIIT